MQNDLQTELHSPGSALSAARCTLGRAGRVPRRSSSAGRAYTCRRASVQTQRAGTSTATGPSTCRCSLEARRRERSRRLLKTVEVVSRKNKYSCRLIMIRTVMAAIIIRWRRCRSPVFAPCAARGARLAVGEGCRLPPLLRAQEAHTWPQYWSIAATAPLPPIGWPTRSRTCSWR